MRTIKTRILVIGVAAILPGGDKLLADATLYTARLCNACHGLYASAPIQPTYPKLAGQNSAYCQQQVRDIKSGARANGLTALMKPLAQVLTEEEITKLCDYVAGL